MFFNISSTFFITFVLFDKPITIAVKLEISILSNTCLSPGSLLYFPCLKLHLLIISGFIAMPILYCTYLKKAGSTVENSPKNSLSSGCLMQREIYSSPLYIGYFSLLLIPYFSLNTFLE